MPDALTNQKWKSLRSRLKRSRFRSGFTLDNTDVSYVRERGLEIIRKHAYDLLSKRLMPAEPKNDGNQTPTKGHPVFIAQHATASCCRKCVSKWHKIKSGSELTGPQMDYLVAVILQWISEQIPSNPSHT